MVVSQSLIDIVNSKVIECVTRILGQDKCSKINIPVYFRTNMKGIAGLAYCNPEKFKIELSTQLFLKNTQSFLEDTIPHEVAHILTEILFPDAKQGHGPEWKSIMKKLGVVPNRHHTYDVSSCFKNNHRYVCSCERVFSLSNLKHKKINSGKSSYSCPSCMSVLMYFPINDTYSNI